MSIIPVRHLFAPLDALLIQLLESLSEAQWNAQTVASRWKVKDVAAHLLDGNLRTLSIQRDGFFGEAPPAEGSYEGLVAWLNELNADWVKASRRLSPQVLTMLLGQTGPQVTAYYNSVDLYSDAVFPVAWAGEEKSFAWMHLAREYTERWLHQQQIRDAIGDDTLMEAQWFQPFIQTFVRALPHTYQHVAAPAGTCVQLSIGNDHWYIRKEAQWILEEGPASQPAALVRIAPDDAWKLFSKSWRSHHLGDRIHLEGDVALASPALHMVSVMA